MTSRSPSSDATDVEEPQDVAPPSAAYPDKTHLAITMASILATMFLGALDQTIIGTAIPKITDEFRQLDRVSWFGAAYFMTAGGSQPTWGKINKHFSLKAAFITAVAIFELGSLLCGVAPVIEVFILGRAIAGIGFAGIASTGLTIIALSTPPEKRPIFLSSVGASYAVSAVFGPLIGGAFSDKVTWRWCFYINLPIGGVVLIAMVFFFRTPSMAKPVNIPLRAKIANLDLPGALLVMGAIISFILALQYGGQSMSWRSSTVIGLLVGFVLISAVAVARQIYLGDKAMIPPRLLRQRSVWSFSSFQFFFAGSYFIALYYLPIYFQSIRNDSPINSGVKNIPLILGATVAIIAMGPLVVKMNRSRPVMIVGSALATVASGLIYTFGEDTPAGRWIGYQVLAGFAWGGAFQMAVVSVQASVSAQDMSTATAITFSFQTFGGAFGVSAAQCAFVNRLIGTLAETAPGIDPNKVLLTGATEIRSVFPQDQVPFIVDAYLEGIKLTFILMAAFAGTAFLLSFIDCHKPLDKPKDIKK